MAREAVIIVAGGSGTRMGAELPKQFLPLGGVPLLVRTVRRVKEALPAAAVITVLPRDHMELWKSIRREYLPGDIICVEGGDSRFSSVKHGLAAVPQDCDIVAVHDGVRPLASKELIRRVTETARAEGTAVPVVEMVDSLRETDGGASRIVDRSRFRAVQTPQAFRRDMIERAYAAGYDPSFTDDASVVEAAGIAVTLCAGERGNIKITTPEDLTVAEALLSRESTKGV